jgi:amino acid adenylation domain-containing protein/thioester reductase-like protein
MESVSVAGQAVDYGGFRPVSRLIEEQADRRPGRTAACYAGRTLTYRQLDQLANGLAATAAARGVGKGDRVAVLLVNSLEMPVAYLGMMKLGAVFVPLDPGWPDDRLAATLRVLDPALILCADLRQVPAGHRGAALIVAAGQIQRSDRRPAVPLHPEDLIYGFFTSGTTGIPKCAMNRQAGLSNRLRFMTRYLAATGDEVVLQNSKHTFDSSLWQLCWPLITGGATVLPVQGEFLNLHHTIDAIAQYAVTNTDFVSSIFDVLVAIVDGDLAAQRKLASLRHIIVGSEEINARAVHRFRALLPHVRVTNGYGPTETAIGMVFHPVTDADGDKIPLGAPIDNCYVAVVDEGGGVLARGRTGEIAIGGVCVGDGYHADPAATARAFVPNRFPDAIPGDRLYLSGDLGHLDEQGRLFFVGRKDFQVKIGGVRIELGEVELAAQKCPGVRQAKALVSQRGESKSLALFAAGDAGLTDVALRDHLRRSLPRTSMPRHCIVLAEMPLSEGGKVDWRALRARLDQRLDAEAARLTADSGAAPADAAAADVASVVLRAFRSALARSELDADAHFLDAGGDSIQAVLIVRALTRQCGAQLDVQDLLEHPTARQLAVLIETRRADARAGADANADADADAELMERDSAVSDHEPIRAADRDGPLRTILLTGATGFVGTRLAYELLTRTDLRLCCLSRAGSNAAATHRVTTSMLERGLWEPGFADRIDGFAADLGQPDLELDARTWQHLARSCDLILHNGALVNLVYDYRAHRSVNVSGTAALLRLAMAQRPVPLHYVSTLAALQEEAALRAGQAGEDLDPARARPPHTGYGRSKWVAERYLAEARRRGAVITVLRLGEVLPSQEHTQPNPLALTHLLLSAIHRLGCWPDVPIRSDYTPVDYAAARVAAAVVDRAAWGRTLHVFHPDSVDFAEVLSRAGAPVARVSGTEFLARLHAAADAGDRDLGRLAALLPAPPALPATATLDEAVGGIGPGGAALRELGGLLTDNPALFRKDECHRLEQRSRLADGDLRGPIDAYRGYLNRSAVSVDPAVSGDLAAPRLASPAYDGRGRP